MTRALSHSLAIRILRLLLVALCVLPCTRPRACAAALGLPVPAPTSAAPLPFAPVNEEDESEREEDGTQRAGDPRSERRTDRTPGSVARLPVTPSQTPARLPPHVSLSRPTAADPFRNGLGCPYLC